MWLARRRLHLDIAAEREDDGLSVGVEHARARDVAGTRQSLKGAFGNSQRFAQIITGRLAERDVEPVKGSLRAQCGDTFSLAGVEPVQDLRHMRVRLGWPQDGPSVAAAGCTGWRTPILPAMPRPVHEHLTASQFSRLVYGAMIGLALTVAL